VPHSTPSNRPPFASLPRNHCDDATCTTRSHSFASFQAKLENPSPICFTMKQPARCQCVSSHRLHPLIGFEAQTDKPPPTWFWGPNQEIVAGIWMPKSPNRRPWFWGPNQETVAMVLRLNHWQTVATDFEAKLKNPLFSSPPQVQSGSHTVSPDLPIVYWPSTRLVPNHPRSSALSLLLMSRSSSLPATSHLPPTHHETSKHVSRHRITQYGLVQPKCTKFKFKLEQVNYSSHI
jgi:hypothetical protein